MLRPNLSRITEEPTRTALEIIQKNIESSDLLKGQFKLFIINIPGTVTNQELFHNMGFIPTDIITTRSSGSYTWDYDQFTDQRLFITTTTAISIRCLVGRI